MSSKKGISKHLRAEQVKDIYANSLTAILANLVFIIILSAFLWKYAAHQNIIYWLYVNIAAIAVHVFFYLKFRNTPPEKRDSLKWSRTITVTFALRAMAFGSGGILLFVHDSIALPILLISLAGLASGAISSYHMMKHIAIIFLFSYLTPVTYSLLACQQGPHLLLAFICLVSIASMIFLTLRLNKTYTKNIILHIDNESLSKEWTNTFNSVDDIIFVLDKEHTIIRANRQAFKRFGKTNEQLVGSHCYAIMHCSDSPIQGCPHSKLLKDGKPHSFELFDEPTQEYFQVNVYPTYDSEGDLIGSVHVLRDITELKEKEAALKESEQNYKILFEHSPHAIMLVDPMTGKALSFNKRALDMLGYSEEEFKEMKISDIDAAETPEETKAHFDLILKNGHDRFETKMRTSSGEIINVIASAHVINRSGQPVFLGSFEDITEILKYRRSMEVLMNATDDSMLLVNINGDIQVINKPGAERLFHDEKTIIGKNAYALLPPEIAESRKKLLDSVTEKGVPLHFEDHRNGMDIENHVYPILNESGIVERLAVFSRNITEKNVQQKKLDMLYRAIEATQVGITICDTERSIIYVNGADARMHGYSVEELIGQKTSIYKTHKQIPQKKLTDMPLKDGWVRESINIDRDGRPFPVMLSSVYIKDAEGSTNAMITVCEDISELKDDENRLRQALAQRETLLQEIHHRVKNNLNVIQSLLSLQASQSYDKDTKDVLDESQRRVRAMSMIHERLYRSSDLSNINFSEYIGSLAKELFDGYSTSNKNIEFNIEIPDIPVDIDIIIPCGLIVNELITNALKYAFPNNAKGKLFIGIEYDENKLPFLLVRDNGIGLPKGFDMDECDSLGMKIITALSEQIGAKHTLQSNGSGTEFSMKLKRYHLNPIEWMDNKHNVGHAEIDDQHQALYRKLEDFRIIIESRNREVDIDATISDIVSAAKKHFKMEELLMEQHDYPDIRKHKDVHEQEVRELEACISSRESEMPMQIYDSLYLWLENHIGDEDKDLGNFLRDKVAVVQEPNEDIIQMKRPANYQILLIEDDKLSQMAMSNYLSKHRYSYFVASNGKEALDAIKESTFELVISDCMLPDMNGMEIIKSIREYGVQTTVLFLTGKDVADAERQVEGLNVLGVMAKPISFPSIKKKLTEYFNK